MISFHFITPAEDSEILKNSERCNKAYIAAYLNFCPEAKRGAEEYFNFLKSEEEKRRAYEAKYKNRVYPANYWNFPDHIEKRNEHGEKQTAFYCLERVIGKAMYDVWEWGLPDMQAAYTRAKVAGADFYKQYESNPDGAIDALDNLRDRTEYTNEAKKIETGVKHGKYENQ